MSSDSSPPLPSRGARTIVLGLGNPLLRDDAVGLEVVAALQRRMGCASLPGVDVLASTRAGFEILDLLRDYDRAILVDALTPARSEPGHVRRLSLADVSGSARLVGGHDISVGVAFELAKRLGIAMPRDVTIYGIEAADTYTFSEALSPGVAASVEPLAEAIFEGLRQEATEEGGSARGARGDTEIPPGAPGG